MLTAKLRQVGGSVMVAIPPALLEQLHLGAQSSVGLAVDGGRITVEPVAARRRYSLAELLAQCDPGAPLPPNDADWTSGPAAGEEIV